MKLYYSPGACSLAPHIVAREVGLDIELCRVNLKTHKLEDGGDFTHINPKGQVPTLQLENGDLLTESPAVSHFLAKQNSTTELIPQYGSRTYYELLSWLNFIATEVHKAFVPLFWDKSESEQIAAREILKKRFSGIEQQLHNNYLLGNQLTIADPYLFTVHRWSGLVGIDSDHWPKLKAFSERMTARPAVRKALDAEGLTEN